MSASAPEPDDSGADASVKSRGLKETVLPALGFTALVCAVWYAYFKINTDAPPPEPKVVLAPVERPKEVVGELFVPNPQVTWAALRPFGSAAFAIYPVGAATFITAAFGLPPYLDSQIRDTEPLVGAVGVDDRGAYWVLGAPVQDGREMLKELTEGNNPFFFKEDHKEAGITLVQPKPGRTPVALVLGISGDMVLLAEDDEQLLKLGPYVARNLPTTAKDKRGDVVAEFEPTRLAKYARSLVKSAPSAAINWFDGIARAKVTAKVKDEQLAITADLALGPELKQSLDRVKPGPVGPLLSLSKGSAVNALAQGLLEPAVVSQALEAGDDDEQLQERVRSLAAAAGPHIACTADGSSSAGVVCRSPSEDNAGAVKALNQLAKLLETDPWNEKLGKSTSLRLVREAKPTKGVNGIALSDGGDMNLSLAWRQDESEVLVAGGTQPLPALAQRLDTWTPTEELLVKDKVVRQWFQFKTPVYAAVMLRPGLLLRVRAAAREEAAMALWLEPGNKTVRLQLRAERDAIRYLAATLR